METIITSIPSRAAFFKGKGSLEIGYPWLSFGAIIALESMVSKDSKVLEFGSGGSTVFWADSCKNVRSYETNPGWYELAKKRLTGYKNTELKLANEKETLDAIDKEPYNYYDFVLIDSYPKDIQRLLLAQAVIPKIKINGFMILDNYMKFGMQDFKYPPKWEIYTFDEFGYSGKGTRICKKIE